MEEALLAGFLVLLGIIGMTYFCCLRASLTSED